MSFGMSMSMSQSMSLEQFLSPMQLLSHQLSLEAKLARRIHGDDEVYRPKGTCPHCEKQLKPAEIVKGFNRNPQDFTTRCPGCKRRFAPILVSSRSIGSIEIPFYCALQTLGMLKPEMIDIQFEEFKRRMPTIYRSAFYHFGSLKAAFSRIKLSYKHEPRVSSWQKKVFSFLGRLPDKTIASSANVSVSEVRKLRKEKGVSPYRRGNF